MAGGPDVPPVDSVSPEAPPGPAVAPSVARVPVWRSLRVRLALAFVAALVAMAASQAWVISQQRPLREGLRVVVEGYLPLSKQVARLIQDHERVRRDLEREASERPRPAEGVLGIYVPQMRDNLEIARILAESLRARPAAGPEQAVLTRTLGYLERVESLQAELEGALAVWVQGGDGLAAGRTMRTTIQQMGAELDRLSRTLDQRIVALTGDVERQQAQATAVAVALFALAGSLALLLLLLSLVALRPIGQLTAEVQRMAAGARGARVEVRGRDEVGVLATEFNGLARAIEQRDRRLTERNAQLDLLSRHLASVFDAIDDALVVVEEGGVSRCNPAATARWGVEPGQPPPDTLLAVLRPGVHELTGEDGTRHAVTAAAFGGAGVVAVIREVTELVRAQEALARSERLALVGQMLAQITHEVRNPLNALSLNAELLADELPDEREGDEAREILSMIRGEVARLTDVTGHYLQLARRPPARPAPTDVPAVLEEVVRLLEPEIEQVGADLSLVVATAVPIQAVDGNQLRQAVLNVVRNAVEAGARTLALSVGVDEDEVQVALQDDGPGMTASESARATDPFYSTKASGTGLGLAIVRQILEDHGGRVDLVSAPGQGTQVVLVWPRRDTAAEAGVSMGEDGDGEESA